ncbi:acyltransferase family protein [Segnochrobactrum spirostomi]|uniref:Acyltransferase n=1 Tax=Segnochrobactrum spirostomi TaxID=2608987 RepID=A0A6A7Y5L9_9HYPH|nr:acyltransferase [Segnochrobactrum spirostomi]MQT13458.1 acyltransferase [Segnochrobactrum spirostomi]
MKRAMSGPESRRDGEFLDGGLLRGAVSPVAGGHAFATLDGVRAVAAAAVVVHHGPDLFGVPGGSLYLAVDVFFVVSGFVIAHAFGPAIAARGAPAFLRLRLTRLAPLYALGLALGTAVALRAAALRPGIAADDLVLSIVAGLLLLPVPATGAAFLYPLMPVAWSLALEIGVNALAALVWGRLSGSALGVVLVGAALALSLVALRQGGLDVGWNGATALGGPPRALYGFAAGLLLHRLWASGRGRLRLPAILVLAAIALMLALPPAVPRAGWDLAVVLVAAPALVWLAVCSKPPPRLHRLCVAAGGISYAIYALHLPLLRLGRAMFADILSPPWTALAGIGLIAATAGAATVLYDRPLRRWMAPRLRPALRVGGAR